jgi:hypothetical protein
MEPDIPLEASLVLDYADSTKKSNVASLREWLRILKPILELNHYATHLNKYVSCVTCEMCLAIAGKAGKAQSMHLGHCVYLSVQHAKSQEALSDFVSPNALLQSAKWRESSAHPSDPNAEPQLSFIFPCKVIIRFISLQSPRKYITILIPWRLHCILVLFC